MTSVSFFPLVVALFFLLRNFCVVYIYIFCPLSFGKVNYFQYNAQLFFHVCSVRFHFLGILCCVACFDMFCIQWHLANKDFSFELRMM